MNDDIPQGKPDTALSLAEASRLVVRELSGDAASPAPPPPTRLLFTTRAFVSNRVDPAASPEPADQPIPPTFSKLPPAIRRRLVLESLGLVGPPPKNP